MALKLETIEARAVKTGVKQSKKLGHLVSPAELLEMRVQIMPLGLRIFLFLTGVALIVAGCNDWPVDSSALKIGEFAVGIFSVVFAIFGIRRTLSTILDSMDAVDVVGGIIDLIGDAVSGFDL